MCSFRGLNSDDDKEASGVVLYFRSEQASGVKNKEGNINKLSGFLYIAFPLYRNTNGKIKEEEIAMEAIFYLSMCKKII